MTTHTIHLVSTSDPEKIVQSLQYWLAERNTQPTQTESIMRQVAELVASVHQSGCDLMSTGSNLTVTRDLRFDDLTIRLIADYSIRVPGLWERLVQRMRGGHRG